MTQLEEAVRVLIDHEVDFVIIEGVAATIHGSSYITKDLDICYSRTFLNLEKLSAALLPFHPTLRNAPKDLPFRLDPPTLRAGLNFTLDTDLGSIDILGEVSGLGQFEQVKHFAEKMNLYTIDCYVLNLEGLIKAKWGTGREKDKAIALELEAIREKIQREKT